MTELRGAHVVLTGASRGLGAVIAEALAHEGANLTLAARSPVELEATRRRVADLGVRAVAVVADVGDGGDRRALLDAARDALGPVDVLVNNAGLMKTAAFVDFDPASIERMVAVNLTAPLLLTQLVLPEMLERGRGHVVNVGSIAGKTGAPYEVVYSATKGALVRATEGLRAELAGTGVSVSVVCPGWVEDVGMYARMVERTGVRASRVLGTTTPEKVARGIVRALRHDPPEVIVTPGPFRLLLAVADLVPRSRVPITNRFVRDQMRRVVATEERLRASG